MNWRSFIIATLLGGLATTTHAAEEISLFDGQSLDGWNVRKGEEKWWQVRDGMLIGGSLEKKVPHNTFLATDRRFHNFVLTFSVRMVTRDGFMNSGVQVRSIRKPKSHEMIGYQVDVGSGYWGKMYDESRRNKMIALPQDPKALKKVVREDGWNHYRVLCEGPRIRTWINEVLAFDYTEKKPEIPLDGMIGLQAHGGGRFEVQFKDMTLKPLPDTPNAPTWPEAKKAEKPAPQPLDKPKDQVKSKATARTPAEEMASFQLPEGFVAELVASEAQGANKPVTVQWDARGRMWTMTAVEYPMDGNENMAAAEAKFAAGGRDQVLVFDDPYGPGPHTPRVFADGLVIPLGILPHRGGALVQYGTQIRHYHDRDGDGKAEGFEVVLDGFGIQDSHLFPHQFERAPGGWIYLAQGLFNRSKVVRPDGQPFADGRKSVTFDQCKLGRFQPDGSMFELLTAGPNNIWGFIQKNNGKMFLQEANDIGIPIAEYIRGSHYATGSREKLQPYAPQVPPSFKGRVMGGTGLSGLALTENADNPFNQLHPDAENVVYVANPITNRIQIITTKSGPHGHDQYAKEKDFLIARDPWFRPVAVHFGPDGCLYIVDWYNKIISHNEVPRTHPDRDKTRGRIWRIRHVDQKVNRPPDLMQVPEAELLTHLESKNERIARFAWHAIADRNAHSLVPELKQRMLSAERENVRILALWALEDLGVLDPEWLRPLVADDSAYIRTEAVRACGRIVPSPEMTYDILQELADDPNYRVRAELANAIRSQPVADARLIGLVAKLGKSPSDFGDRRDYDRLFERYLARWAMEKHAAATRALLQSKEAQHLNQEQRLLVIQTLPANEAAEALLSIADELERVLDLNELRLIVSLLDVDSVREKFAALLKNADRQVVIIDRLAQLEPALRSSPKLVEIIEPICRNLPTTDRAKVIRWAKIFRLSGLEDAILSELGPDRSGDEIAAALATLREIGSTDHKTFQKYAKHPDPEVQRKVVLGMAQAPAGVALDWFAERWNELPGDHRQLAVIGLSSTKERAAAFAERAAAFEDMTSAQLGLLSSVLGADHPAMKKLMETKPGMLAQVIRLTGKPQDAVMSRITLEGPFTVESWIKLDPGIGNEDHLMGRKGSADFNFYNGKLHLYSTSKKTNLLVSNRGIDPNVWIHCAVTRDASGQFKIYLDGTLDAEGGVAETKTYTDLNIGTTTNGRGAAQRMMEFRVWDRARSADEILHHYRSSLKGSRAEGLVYRLSGDSEDIPFRGDAKREATADFPELISPEEADAAREKFNKYLDIVQQPGDPQRGKRYFASCLACHRVGDQGVDIGPDLSGVGAMSDEALLHNILTPNAAMESGYYRHDVMRRDGRMVSGMLVEKTKQNLTIRPIGGELIVVPRKDVLSHHISKTSLMPEGLIEHLSSQQVADLFAYIRTLNGTTK